MSFLVGNPEDIFSIQGNIVCFLLSDKLDLQLKESKQEHSKTQEKHKGLTKDYNDVQVNMSCLARKPVRVFRTRSDTNLTVQPQKMARGLIFGIKKAEIVLYM